MEQPGWTIAAITLGGELRSIMAAHDRPVLREIGSEALALHRAARRNALEPVTTNDPARLRWTRHLCDAIDECSALVRTDGGTPGLMRRYRRRLRELIVAGMGLEARSGLFHPRGDAVH
jgi:hypothetical protein